MLDCMSLDAFVEVAKRFSLANPITLRAIAYPLIRLQRIPEGLEYLEQLRSTVDLGVPWQANLEYEAQKLLNLIVSDPTAATRQIEDWELQTQRNLGFEEKSS